MFVCSSRMPGFTEAIMPFTLSRVNTPVRRRKPKLAVLSSLRPVVRCVAPQHPIFSNRHGVDGQARPDDETGRKQWWLGGEERGVVVDFIARIPNRDPHMVTARRRSCCRCVAFGAAVELLASTGSFAVGRV